MSFYHVFCRLSFCRGSPRQRARATGRIVETIHPQPQNTGRRLLEFKRARCWYCVSVSCDTHKVLTRRAKRFELSASSLHSLLSRHIRPSNDTLHHHSLHHHHHCHQPLNLHHRPLFPLTTWDIDRDSLPLRHLFFAKALDHLDAEEESSTL